MDKPLSERIALFAESCARHDESAPGPEMLRGWAAEIADMERRALVGSIDPERLGAVLLAGMEVVEASEELCDALNAIVPGGEEAETDGLD